MFHNTYLQSTNIHKHNTSFTYNIKVQEGLPRVAPQCSTPNSGHTLENLKIY